MTEELIKLQVEEKFLLLKITKDYPSIHEYNNNVSEELNIDYRRFFLIKKLQESIKFLTSNGYTVNGLSS